MPKYRDEKTTKGQSVHKNQSLRKDTWVCNRNKNNSHVFSEFIPNTEKVKEWIGTYLYRKVGSNELNLLLRNPRIIETYQYYLRTEATKNTKGWSHRYWKSMGVAHNYECVNCGKLAIDFELKRDKRIKKSLPKDKSVS